MKVREVGKCNGQLNHQDPSKPEKNIEWALRQNRPGCWLSQNVSLRCFSMFVQVHLWLPTYGVACDFLVWSHSRDLFLAQHGCSTTLNDKWQNVLKRIWDAWDVWASCTWDELSDAKDFNNLPMCKSFVRAKLQEAKEQKCQSKPQHWPTAVQAQDTCNPWHLFLQSCTPLWYLAATHPKKRKT